MWSVSCWSLFTMICCVTMDRMKPQQRNVIVTVTRTTFCKCEIAGCWKTLTTHTDIVILSIWHFLQCLQQFGGSNSWWISVDLHWLLTPAIQTNPCSALCNQPCPGKTISFPNDSQRPTWQVWPDTWEICKVGRKGGGKGGLKEIKALNVNGKRTRASSISQKD